MLPVTYLQVFNARWIKRLQLKNLQILLLYTVHVVHVYYKHTAKAHVLFSSSHVCFAGQHLCLVQ